MNDREVSRDPGYAYVWEYLVRPEHVTEFEAAYGRSGDWARLFRQAAGYLGTELHRDRADPRRFLTIDYWQTFSDWKRLRAEFGDEFEALDRRCEKLTDHELEIGRFDPVL